MLYLDIIDCTKTMWYFNKFIVRTQMELSDFCEASSGNKASNLVGSQQILEIIRSQSAQFNTNTNIILQCSSDHSKKISWDCLAAQKRKQITISVLCIWLGWQYFKWPNNPCKNSNSLSQFWNFRCNKGLSQHQTKIKSNKRKLWSWFYTKPPQSG